MLVPFRVGTGYSHLMGDDSGGTIYKGRAVEERQWWCWADSMELLLWRPEGQGEGGCYWNPEGEGCLEGSSDLQWKVKPGQCSEFLPRRQRAEE